MQTIVDWVARNTKNAGGVRTFIHINKIPSVSTCPVNVELHKSGLSQLERRYLLSLAFALSAKIMMLPAMNRHSFSLGIRLKPGLTRRIEPGLAPNEGAQLYPFHGSDQTRPAHSCPPVVSLVLAGVLLSRQNSKGTFRRSQMGRCV